MGLLNRNIMILRPQKPFYDWMMKVDPSCPIIPELMDEHDNSHVYLIPEMESSEEFETWLKEHYDFFFTEELFFFCDTEKQFPKDRSWEVFNQWIVFNYQSMVIDTVEGPLTLED